MSQHIQDAKRLVPLTIPVSSTEHLYMFVEEESRKQVWPAMVGVLLEEQPTSFIYVHKFSP